MDIMAALSGQPLATVDQPDSLQGIVPRAFTHEQIATGRHGGLGQLLGYLKDAALVSAGLQPEYQPGRIAARQADALEGFETDPSGAIDRLTAAGFNNQARDLFNDTVMNQQRHASGLASQAEALAAKARADAAKAASDLKTFGAAGAMLRTATDKNYDAVRDRVDSFLTTRGVSAPLPLPDKYDKDAVNAWANAGIDTDKQNDNERQQDALDETKNYHGQSINLRSQEVGNQGRNIDSEIGDRIADNKRSDNSAAELADFHKKSLDLRARGLDKRNDNIDSLIRLRQFNIDHPSKNRLFTDMPPPRKAGDVLHASDGKTYHSVDGKTWSN